MAFRTLVDQFSAWDEGVDNFQDWQPEDFEDDVDDQELVSDSSDRTREDEKGNLEYRCDDGKWGMCFRSKERKMGESELNDTSARLLPH